MGRMAGWVVAVAVGCGVLAGPVMAASPVKMGTLKCDVDGRKKKLFQRTLYLACTFSDTNDAVIGKYTGVIERTGLSVGDFESREFIWVVATVGDPSDNKIGGKYFGATAGGTVGEGAGADYLVGLNGRISLQPISVETMSGLGFDIDGQSLVLTEE